MREFMEHLGVPCAVLRSLREFCPDCANKGISGPDVKIKCTRGSCQLRVRLELMEYQADQQVGGSQARRLHGVWQGILKHLRENHLGSNSALEQVYVHVSFHTNDPPRIREAPRIADELVGLIFANVDFAPSSGPYGPISFAQDSRTFAAYPCLARRVRGIRVSRYPPSYLKGPFLWSYDATSDVGVVAGVVLDLITKKTATEASYDWSGTDERWLLICAGAAIPADSAGPDHGSNRTPLRSSQIVEAARRSGYDRVYFWERMHEWHERIHP